MKRIGRGWLYAVYDLGDGRVRKIVYSSWLRAITVFFQTGRFSIPLAKKEIKRIFKDAFAAYALIRRADSEVFPMLGNPVFINELEYEQDRTHLFNDAFKKEDVNGKKRLINQYVDFIQKMWMYGVADKIFNFSINNGIDEEGNIVQIDFGELSLSKEEVQEEIRQESWLTSFSYLRLLPVEVKEYYRERMRQEISLQNLEKYWLKR